MTLIATLRSKRHTRMRSRTPPDFTRFDSSVRAISEAFPGYTATPRLALEEILSLLEQSARTWDWAKVKLGDVALVAQGTFSGELQVSPRLQEFLDRELECTTNPVLLRSVCEAYIGKWEGRSARSRQLAKLIRERSQYLPGNWTRLFIALPEALDANQAPELIASRMVTQPDPFQWLRTCGVPSPHSGQMMKELHEAWIKVLPEPRAEEDILRIFRWIRPDDNAPISDDWAASAISKLLSPWLTSEPDAKIRQDLLDRITDAYGDPRKGSLQFWKLVPEPCRRLVMKWLAGKSMDALLSIITRSTANHMWPPRHDFWKGLYDRGFIQEAWIALSPAASKDAEYMHQQTGDAIYTMAGRQLSPRRRETCLLIMRVGKYIVVEGSHDYRIHLFPANERSEALLYRDTYDAEAMTLPLGDPSTRIHDAPGRWTEWVEKRVLR